MFRVVTIAREYGSGGAAIAQRVARLLGWKLLDRNLINAVAQLARVDSDSARRYDECVDSWWHRINRGGLWSLAITAGASPVDVQFFDAETMASFAEQVIAGVASEGDCVIVGRGAQCVLHGSPQALHTFVYAPWSDRVARVRERIENHGDPGELIESTDRTRAAYIRRYFGRDWKDPDLYHMMLSSRLGEEALSRMIANTVQAGA